MKFDFLFLDSTHVSPGEILNFIESLPFLKENVIVVIHDLLWHFRRKSTNMKCYPSCISLISTLFGEKVFLKDINGKISNIGAVFLFPNQEKHYMDYFLLLLNFWEYMPKDKQIDELRIFIKNFYKDIKYIEAFNLAERYNKNWVNRTMKLNDSLKEKNNILISLGTKWN